MSKSILGGAALIRKFTLGFVRNVGYSGVVHLFRGALGTESLTASDEPRATPCGFAWPLNVVGDIDGDRRAELVVGDFPSGSAYLFHSESLGLGTVPMILHVEGAPMFGFSVGSGAGG